MMASMAQQFHPGGMSGNAMMAHGHPMASGHPSNQGMPVGPGGVVMTPQMQAQMGVPQVSQPGGVMTMPPGVVAMGGPSAHALQHLNPAQTQQQQQQIIAQQQQMAHALQSNPQLAQQHFQQQQMQQQMQRQRLLQQHQMMQQHGNGMPINPAQAGLTPAQFQAMQNAGAIRPPVNLPAHLQQQQAQAQHAQQAHQAQQLAHHQQQLQAQQQHAVQQHQVQAQQMAAQQQLALQQNAAQAGNASTQPGQQGPARAPPQMQGGNENQVNTVAQQQQAQAQAHQAHQAQQAQAQAQAQASSQAQQAQINAQAQAHAQQQQQVQQQAQAQAQAQSNQQSPAQQQGQPPDPSAQPQQPQPQQMRPGQIQVAQREQVMQRMRMQQQQNAQATIIQNSMHSLLGAKILELLSFGDHLSQFSSQAQKNNGLNGIKYWQSFVDKFFSSTGVLRQQLQRPGESKNFEIGTAAIARYYHTHFTNGVEDMQMIMEQAREKDLPNGGCVVESPKCRFIYWYTNGCHVIFQGSLKAEFNQDGKIEILEQFVTEHKEHVPRSKISNPMESPDQKSSPTISKGTSKKAIQQRNKAAQEQSSQAIVPPSMVCEWGVAKAVGDFLDMAETFSRMTQLFQFSQEHPKLSVQDSLHQLVLQHQARSNANMSNNPLMAFPGGPPGQRTPGPGFQNQFGSPAAGANMNLPGASPANMSPAVNPHNVQNHPAAGVAMMAQASQQGSAGSQGTSANTSPNVSNKRRRPSGVKAEDEMAGIEMNGAKVKPSPKIGNNKRLKGN